MRTSSFAVDTYSELALASCDGRGADHLGLAIRRFGYWAAKGMQEAMSM